jgi:hypothetical protein
LLSLVVAVRLVLLLLDIQKAQAVVVLADY